MSETMGSEPPQRPLLTADELLTTTRTVRKRLNLELPVPREVIEECIDVALQAPSGSMKQNWRFLAIDDPTLKEGIAEIYRDCFRTGIASPGYAETLKARVGSSTMERVLESGEHLAENLGKVPWLVIPCGTGRVLDNPTVSQQANFWASTVPAMWSFMLAARSRALGCAWTTAHLKAEERVAELVGIPYPEVTQCGLLAVGYYTGTTFKPAQLVPPASVTHWNRWPSEDAETGL